MSYCKTIVPFTPPSLPFNSPLTPPYKNCKEKGQKKGPLKHALLGQKPAQQTPFVQVFRMVKRAKKCLKGQKRPTKQPPERLKRLLFTLGETGRKIYEYAEARPKLQTNAHKYAGRRGKRGGTLSRPDDGFEPSKPIVCLLQTPRESRPNSRFAIFNVNPLQNSRLRIPV